MKILYLHEMTIFSKLTLGQPENQIAPGIGLIFAVPLWQTQVSVPLCPGMHKELLLLLHPVDRIVRTTGSEERWKPGFQFLSHESFKTWK